MSQEKDDVRESMSTDEAPCFSEIRIPQTEILVRRSRLEMELDILYAINKGNHSAIHVLRNANTDYVIFYQLAAHLSEQNLLVKVRSGRRFYYYLTKEGERTVGIWQWLRQAVGYGSQEYNRLSDDSKASPDVRLEKC